MFYVYTICMKNGKEYKTEITLNLEELISELMPKDLYEIKMFHCKLFNERGKSVVIIGSEVSSIEYFVETKQNSWD